MEKGIGAKNDFRWRGGEISRVEGFSDAVFAFALTLLIVSLEVPKTFDKLVGTMRGFIAFAFCFLILVQLWYYHYIFFRRYGLQDFYTMALNVILLFVILFYVYPLKFLATLLLIAFTGADLNVTLPNGLIAPMIQQAQVSELIVIYGLGFGSASLIFLLLYLHAYRKRGMLELNELEIFDTRGSILENLYLVGIAALSVIIATFGGTNSAGPAGFTYFLIGPIMTIHGFSRGKQRRKIEELTK